MVLAACGVSSVLPCGAIYPDSLLGLRLVHSVLGICSMFLETDLSAAHLYI